MSTRFFGMKYLQSPFSTFFCYVSSPKELCLSETRERDENTRKRMKNGLCVMKCNEKIGRNGVSSYLCIVRTRHVEPFKQKKKMKKMFFLMAMFAMMTLTVQAQKNDVTAPVYDKVEVMPEFPGGMTAMMEFIMKTMKYPKEAEKQQLQGRTLVCFIVEADGSVSNLDVMQSSHPILDKEALRVVGLMPKWKPGRQKGKAVRVSYVLPVTFALN